MWTAIGAFLFVIVGFMAGAGGSAWLTRDHRAEPWRKLRVEQEGHNGASTRTRVVFENPKLPLQAIELFRSPEGRATRALVALRDGQELAVEFEEGRPSAVEAADGKKALFSFKGQKARVAFFDSAGKQAGDRVVVVPVELLGALKLARQEVDGQVPSRALGSVLTTVAGVLCGEAWAQENTNGDEGGDEEEDEVVDVVREVELSLDVTMPGAKSDAKGKAQVEANCPPFTCLATTADVGTPGASKVRLTVAGSKKKSELDSPDEGGALESFRKDASKERETAGRVLPDISATVAAVTVATLACRSLKLDWGLCVDGLTKATASGAIHSVATHDVDMARHIIDKRAKELFFQEQAREALDAPATFEVCVFRNGYARACTKLTGSPFGEQPMDLGPARLELRRGIGGTLIGSHLVTQSDGSDCKFSPAPKAAGSLSMSFDSDKGELTATLKADEKGTRANLGCSMGSANMRWTNTYTITASQTFTKEQLNAGGKLALKLIGTMKGVSSYSFSNCRSGGGVSANCPGGKREAYSYATELSGELDLDTQNGSGRITVSQAPLATRGTWQIPAAGPSP